MKKNIGKVVGIGVAIIGVGLLKLLSDNKNTKYSNKWFEVASDDELEVEREKVRQEYCSSGDNYSLAVGLQKLLWRFDDVMSKRSWNGSTDYGYPKHREHGWYLPNDDD
ncbi:hypothetical protein FACS1894132_05510 [Clostridia bacterium]|nr:hypothetical protein FACS1894132_05510 [Clostridia bacterium]